MEFAQTDNSVTKHGHAGVRRGRPRKATGDAAADLRRERNRAAQRDFRLRQQASERDQKKKADALEAIVGRVVRIFLDFSDCTVKSPFAQQDKSLMSLLQQSICALIGAVGEIDDPSTQNNIWTHSALDPAGITIGDQCQTPSRSGFAGSDAPFVCPLELDKDMADAFTTNSEPQTSADHVRQYTPQALTQAILQTTPQLPIQQPLPLYASSNLISLSSERTMCGADKLPHNIFGNGWLGPMSSYHFFTNPPPPRPRNLPRLDNPLSLQITSFAINLAYNALLRNTDLNDPRITRPFGHMLRYLPKEEVIRYFRWRFAQGLPELHRLATITTDNAKAVFADMWLERPEYYMGSGPMISDADRPECFDEFCNANEVATFLRKRLHGVLLDQDVMEMAVSVRAWVAAKVAHGPEGALPTPYILSSRNGNSDIGNDATLDETMMKVRVSKRALLDNIVYGGTCLGAGPMFPRGKLEDMVVASALPF